MEGLGAGSGRGLGVRSTDPRHAIRVICGGPLWGLFIVLGLEIYGAALTIPIFAFFCMEELGLSATHVGTLLAAFNLAQALGGPVFGRVADAVGRRWVLLLCFFWSSCCFFLTSLVTSFLQLLTIRAFAGLSGGSIPVCSAIIMDCAEPAERPSVLGFQGAVLGITFTLGPLTVVTLLAFELVVRRQVFIMAGAFCLLGFIVGLFILRESLPTEKRRPLCGQGTGEQEGGDSGCMAGMNDDWSNVRFALVCVWIARFFYALGVFCLYATYAFLIRDNFGWSDREFGIILVSMGLIGAILSVFFYPLVSAYVEQHWCCVIGYLVLCVVFPFITSQRLWLHFLALVVFQFGQALAEPGIINLVGLHAPSERHMGFAMGMSNCFRATASVIGPFMAGRLYDMDPRLPYGMGSLAFLSAMVFVFGALMLGVEPAQEKGKLLEAEKSATA